MLCKSAPFLVTVRQLCCKMVSLTRRISGNRASINKHSLYWTRSPNFRTAQQTFLMVEEVLANGIESPDLWRIKGENFLQKEQYVEANQCFDRALRLAPHDAYILNYKGFCLDKLGYYEVALSCFNQAINILPKDPEILTNTGICLCHLNRYTEALVHFENALRNGGGSPTLWNNKGFCLVKLGRYQEAYRAYKVALEQGHSKQVDLLCNIAATLVNLGSYQEALDYFDRALQLNPDDHLLLNNVAICLEQQGRYDLALKCYEKSLSHDPDNATYLCNKGVCLSKMKRWDQALECLKEVVKRDVNNYVAYGELAAIYLAKGQPDEALFYYNKALGLDPQIPASTWA